ncbi:unnamed protein product [Protopolystoma xenopodis]|uniref:Uncharacterized protein n=1 Tax=Protopolystoma xenopodis TaxID=117903 RepID=A0A448WAU1_9PLAT|nr:unnamed protein product [Protopolystoma xenopodis]
MASQDSTNYIMAKARLLDATLLPADSRSRDGDPSLTFSGEEVANSTSNISTSVLSKALEADAEDYRQLALKYTMDAEDLRTRLAVAEAINEMSGVSDQLGSAMSRRLDGPSQVAFSSSSGRADDTFPDLDSSAVFAAEAGLSATGLFLGDSIDLDADASTAYPVASGTCPLNDKFPFPRNRSLRSRQPSKRRRKREKLDKSANKSEAVISSPSKSHMEQGSHTSEGSSGLQGACNVDCLTSVQVKRKRRVRMHINTDSEVLVDLEEPVVKSITDICEMEEDGNISERPSGNDDSESPVVVDGEEEEPEEESDESVEDEEDDVDENQLDDLEDEEDDGDDSASIDGDNDEDEAGFNSYTENEVCIMSSPLNC